MSEPSLSELLAVASEAAYLGGRRTLAYFGTGISVETKADNTPVTRADRECEEIIRARIARSFPGHVILGEEGGETGPPTSRRGRQASSRKSQASPQYRWIIDPIDGTKTFIHGVPLYGVLIGVEVRGKPAVGVVYLPALDEMVAAATGLGCRWNGRLARVSSAARLEDAVLLTTSVKSATARSGAYAKLAAQTRLARTWGDCYGYVLVATGRAEIMLDPEMKPWDSAPFLPILGEAGGRFTTWDGRPTIWGTDAAATNGVLHEQVLAILQT
ncbi:MAG: inositol monophosphatase family protein [Planctomycetota bacterium]|nr:inositol monophosphatase family protein [Planctomycetota bacterium]